MQSPGRLDPVDHPEAALARRNVVLARMAAVGWLTEPERAAAAAEPLGLKLRDIRSGCEAPGVPAPFFCDYVRRALEDGPLGATLGSTREERQQRLLGGGLTIQTTLDTGMQRHAQAVVTRADRRRRPERCRSHLHRRRAGHRPGQGAGRQPPLRRGRAAPGQHQGQPRRRRLERHAGRLDLQAVRAGRRCRAGHPARHDRRRAGRPTPRRSSRTAPRAAATEPYTVSNAGDSNAGRHDLVSATHGSVNTAYLQLLERTGVDRPVAIAEALGLRQFRDRAPSAPLHRGGSFVLGANEVSPLALTAAYAAFAARGTYCPPTPVLQVLDAGGQPVALQPQPCTQALEPQVADTVTSVLRGTIDGPSPGRTARRADIGRPAAGKTGSTNSSRAAWFAGYVPQLAAAVWVGTPVPTPLQDVTVGGQYFRQVYGGTAAGADVARRRRTGAGGRARRAAAAVRRLPPDAGRARRPRQPGASPAPAVVLTR